MILTQIKEYQQQKPIEFPCLMRRVEDGTVFLVKRIDGSFFSGTALHSGNPNIIGNASSTFPGILEPFKGSVIIQNREL